LKTGWWALAAAILSGGPALARAPSAPGPVQTVRWVCEAVYQPSRAVWPRTVELAHDAQRVTAVRIDGQAVYTFLVEGTTVFTSQDNERIQFDTAALSWRSDFRGLAQSQGRCEPTD